MRFLKRLHSSQEVKTLMCLGLFVSLNSVSSEIDFFESLGVSPDCSEENIGIAEIEKIASSSRSQLEFLQNIPKKTLQTFTLIYGTKSLQHHLVDTIWPRVLRSSADAKLVMGFVCNPKSQDYGSVEIMHYIEPPTAKWNSVSLQFRGHETAQVKRNSNACIKCHGVQSQGQIELRPILQEYPVWEGFYGSEDDVIHKGSQEWDDFQKFLEHSKNDPCFQSLPWPQTDDPAYELYPYHEGYDLNVIDKDKVTLYYETKVIKIRNYHLRPNLKFTDALSHLMAQRLAWKFIRNSLYQQVAPLLAMDSIGCKTENHITELHSRFPEVEWEKAEYLHTYMSPKSHKSKAVRLLSLGFYLGIPILDWQMHLNHDEELYYNSGAAGENRRDISISQMAQGILLDQLAKENSHLRDHFRISRGVSKFFAPQDFSCIDDVAGSILIDRIEDKQELCSELSELYQTGDPLSMEKHLIRIDGIQGNSNEAKLLANEIWEYLPDRAKSKASLEVGLETMKQSCLECHETDRLRPHYRFMKSQEELQDYLLNSKNLHRILDDIQTGRMPKDRKPISAQQKESLQAYFLDLVINAKEKGGDTDSAASEN